MKGIFTLMPKTISFFGDSNVAICKNGLLATTALTAYQESIPNQGHRQEIYVSHGYCIDVCNSFKYGLLSLIMRVKTAAVPALSWAWAREERKRPKRIDFPDINPGRSFAAQEDVRYRDILLS
jgi:hypothetical protein